MIYELMNRYKEYRWKYDYINKILYIYDSILVTDLVKLRREIDKDIKIMVIER